ncbi:MAG: hypothetical protein C9356_12230 [Oleiphilus sp.]|nr:MAG: hypothetical protein C9356_12230 [Oleiphilus sp.]
MNSQPNPYANDTLRNLANALNLDPMSIQKIVRAVDFVIPEYLIRNLISSSNYAHHNGNPELSKNLLIALVIGILKVNNQAEINEIKTNKDLYEAITSVLKLSRTQANHLYTLGMSSFRHNIFLRKKHTNLGISALLEGYRIHLANRIPISEIAYQNRKYVHRCKKSIEEEKMSMTRAASN